MIRKKIITHIKNRGTGAGGANTTKNGNSFETKTNIEDYLIKKDFIKNKMSKNKNGYYLEKKIKEEDKDDITLIYMTQNGFREYIKKLDIPNEIYRKPDETYLIISEDKYYLKILEKKNQNVDGSVEEKLKTGLFNKQEYELMLKNDKIEFIIKYGFCLSKFLEEKLNSDNTKYKNMKKLIEKDNIKLFYGDSDDYFDILYDWIKMI